MAGLRTSWRVSRLLSRARGLLTHGKVTEAEPLCQEAVALAPQSAQAWVYLSWAYIDLKRAAEALEACDRALSLDPHNDWAWKNKGMALNRLNRYEEALEAAAHVSANSRELAQQAGWIRAFALSRLGRFDALYDEAEQLLLRNAAHPYNWNWLGEALLHLKRYDEALSMYTKSIELAPRDIRGWRGKAMALSGLKRCPEAYELCDHILAETPDDVDIWRAKSWCLMEERRFPEVIAVCDRIFTSPVILQADHLNKGVALLRVGRCADAARALMQALAGQPDNPRYLNNLGCVYMSLQLYERALSLFERVYALDERLFNGWMSAAEALISLGRYDEAHEPLARAKEFKNTPELSESDAACLAAWQGILHTRQGQYDEAMVAFKEALAADPDDSEACWGFAELLLALGETDKASHMIERSLTLDPFDARAWSLKARILRAAGDESSADEAEAHGQRMLTEQRALLAAWEREQAGQAGAE